MKTTKIAMALITVYAILFTACSKDETDLSVKGVSLSQTSLNLKPGAIAALSCAFYPADAANKNVSWASSDAAVATVSETGVVTAIKPGSTTITVTTQENNEKANCAVTVSNNAPLTVKGAVEGVWEKYSVINVTGQIHVAAGKSLTIQEGVEIVISDAGQDANDTKIEFLVHGSLYCVGTQDAPILFSTTATKRTEENTFSRLWGGIIGSATCSEILMDNVIVEYTGAVTTLSSPSVTGGLFKPAGGEGMVAFNTNNPAGKYVIVNSTFRNNGEDAIYVQGGNCIFANNLFYANGEAGGEAINVKAGCKVDAAFNVMYSPNTNALKLSNSGADGGSRFQAQINGYNNTIINSGWRRDPNKPKGGSVWAEAGCLVNIYNNLIVNAMFAAKAPKFGQDATDGPDLNSKIDYNFYASGTQQSAVPQHITNGTLTAFDGFKAGVKDVVYGVKDISGTAPGDKDPKFVNFPFNTNPLLSYTYDKNWNFHLQADSPAMNGGKTDFEPYFATTGITLNGKVYKSPRPASYFGAYGAL